MTSERKLTKAYNNLVAYILNSVVLDPRANGQIDQVSFFHIQPALFPSLIIVAQVELLTDVEY